MSPGSRVTDRSAADLHAVDLRAVDLHADVRELMARLTDAVDGSRWLDAFLLAAGAVQASEDRLSGTWRPSRRVVDYLDSLSGTRSAALAGPARTVLEASSGAIRRVPPARTLERWTARVETVTGLLADLVLGARDTHRPPPDLHRELLRATDALRRPSAVRQVLGPAVVRPPSCFCNFDQYPEDVAELVRRFAAEHPAHDRPLLVVGVRTSGSYLAPLAGAALRQQGYRQVTVCTARPGASLLPGRAAELRRLVRGEGLVLLLDDPPASGRSLAQVAAAAERAGFPASSIVLLLAVCEDEPVLPRRLDRYPRVVLPGPDWHVRELLRPAALAELVPRLLPDFRPPLEVGPLGPQTRGAHLAVPVTARVDGRTLPMVAESAGLGFLGRRAVVVADALGELVPPVYGFADGVLLRARLPGEQRDRAGERVAPADVARYVAARQRRLAVDADRSLRLTGRGPVWEVASRHLAPILGRPEVLLRAVLLDPLMHRLLTSGRPCVVDGRTLDRNWVADEDGRWVKTDFAEGAFSNMNLTSYDAAYDLAGAAVSLDGLDGLNDTEGELRSRYEELSGERVSPARWCVLCLVQALGLGMPRPGHMRVSSRDRARSRRAQARAVQRFLAETYLSDLTEADPRGPWCVLDVDGVLETDPLDVPAGSPTGMLALRALRAHGYRVLLATGRSLPEIQDRCAAYGLAGGVAEYGTAVHLSVPGTVETVLPAGWEGPDAELRRRLALLPEVTVDPFSRRIVRASLVHDSRRTGLPAATVAALLHDGTAGGFGSPLDDRFDVVPGERQTDFVPHGTDKVHGVRALLALLGADGAVPVLAVGDGPADLGLLRWALNGVAPANASPEVRAAGVPLTRGAYQAGLADAVARLIGHRPGRCPTCRPPRTSAETRALLAVLAIPEAGPRGIPPRLARLAGADLALSVRGIGRHGVDA
ncbi:HAD family phosphatase [Streptomyces kaniharaensis]|uniref:HAD family phosphatase n=1 Tax=Streptomyces kaniharaensis TaxID=212423 RepID=A0A6N7KWR7_9ACTN|nr:HAD hydrolase family protein [Streptomyces kaniharaensis]MQS15215.1 HAD family phosphatase [Streptomyces kaniharaensis]